MVDSFTPQNDAASGEIRALYELGEIRIGGIGMIHQVNRRIAYLTQVVRRDVGSHADRDAGGAIDQKIRDATRERYRLLLASVIIRLPINRVFLYIGQELVGDWGHSRLGVSHGRRR